MSASGGFQTTRIQKVHSWTERLRTITLERAASDFTPGQFFQLGLPLGQSLLQRAYSAASAPGEALEFFVSEVPGGSLTPSLFGLEPGAEVLLSPTPQGFFTLQEVPVGRTLWLLCTGTGLGPYVSMLRAARHPGPTREALLRFERLVLVHGVRDPAELAYGEELAGLSAEGLPLTLVAAISQPQKEAAHRDTPPARLLPGRITTLLGQGALEAEAGCAMQKDSQVLLCGNPAMIQEVTALLAERGLRKHRRREPGQLHFEKYW